MKYVEVWYTEETECGDKLHGSGLLLTSVSCLASDSQVDVALLGCLLHKLYHELMGFAHYGRPVHTDELVSGAQAPVFVRGAVLHDVADVNLKRERKFNSKDFFFFF